MPYPRLLALILVLSGSLAEAGVSVGGDHFLGVWSPMQTRWESRVPVCVTGDIDQSPYRVVAYGQNTSQFALTNDLGDEVRYKVFWHTGNNYKRRETLTPSIPSSGAYANAGPCVSGPTGYVRVRLNRRDIDNAIPAIYQDTLVIMLSPL